MKLYREWLQFNGIKFEETSFGFVFRYQGGTFIIPLNYDDKQFFQILMPHIYDATKNRIIALTAINRLNSEMKVVKASINDDNIVGLAIEMFIDSSPEIDEYMQRIFDILFECRSRFRFMISLSETLALK